RFPIQQGVVGRVLLAYTGAGGAVHDQIRRDGYLIAQGREPYTASVAVPVVLSNGDLLGALVVSGLATRFDARARQRALRLLQHAARAIAGCVPPTPGRATDSQSGNHEAPQHL